MRTWFGAAALAALAALSAGVAAAEPSGVVLQGLDKITARISRIEAPINRPVGFGTLEIIARTCYQAPPEETPESAAFLEIRELKPNEPPIDVFSGWMFASSPALSAMEHPVYDVRVIGCDSGADP